MPGVKADCEGITPHMAHDIFQILINRRHSSYKSLQRTIGSLNWFRKFVPAFFYVTRPVLEETKRAGRLGDSSINFDDKCIKCIEKVRDYILKLPTMHHPDPLKPKSIFVVMGNYEEFTNLAYRPEA